MFIHKPPAISGSEFTDEKHYLNRRNFLRAGIVAATAAATGWVYRELNSPPRGKSVVEQPLADVVVPTTRPTTRSTAGFFVDEPLTSFQDITHYNNFYEFSEDKESVADAAAGFVTRPWQVSVGGCADKPKIFDLDDLLKIGPPEQRVYRMRCVEAWSMVIPWDGFSLSKLLDRVAAVESRRNTWRFKRCWIRIGMPNESSGFWIGRMSRVCGWMRRCIR